MSKDDEVTKNKPVVKAEEDATAHRLAQLMQQFNVGCVVIVEDETPIGIVTDRDLALAIGTSGFDPKTLVAQDIMRSPTETLEAGSSLIEVVGKMAKSGVRRLPVTEEGKLVDIVTMDDVIRLLSKSLNRMEDVIESESPEKIGRQ